MRAKTTLTPSAFKVEAQRFGLTAGQIEKFTLHVFESGVMSITVYPAHVDTAVMTRFLEHLIGQGKAEHQF